MTSTAQGPDRTPTAATNPAPVCPPPQAPLGIPDDAICTPVLPPRIRIPFPAIDFDCGPVRYRTVPVELVAELIPTPRSPASLLHPPASPYSLRKGLGVWHLVFDGQEALLRHERGLLYVAWLLQHPPAEPLHAVDLAAQIPTLYRAQLGLHALTDPGTGHSVPLARHARLQERSLALDDAQSLRAVLRQERELEALLDDESATEPEKAEALRELEAIVEFQRRHSGRSRDAAQRTADAVRQSLRRLHARLAAAVDASGAPHRVLRPFAEHLRRYLLVPSSRYAGRGNRPGPTGRAGCFIYEPPPGVKWQG